MLRLLLTFLDVYQQGITAGDFDLITQGKKIMRNNK